MVLYDLGTTRLSSPPCRASRPSSQSGVCFAIGVYAFAQLGRTGREEREKTKTKIENPSEAEWMTCYFFSLVIYLYSLLIRCRERRIKRRNNGSAPDLNPGGDRSHANLGLIALQGLKPWAGIIPLDQPPTCYTCCDLGTMLNAALDEFPWFPHPISEAE